MLTADVMLRRPGVAPVTASVGEVRAAFADDHVHMVLLVEAGRLRGTLVRADLERAASPAGPALDVASLEGRTVPPHADAEVVRQRLVRSGTRRLAVVDDDGTLLGLLCLKRRQTGFCSDADVAARAADRRP